MEKLAEMLRSRETRFLWREKFEATESPHEFGMGDKFNERVSEFHLKV